MSFMIKLFEYLSEKARGLLLTLGSTGIGTMPEIIEKTNSTITNPELIALQNIQKLAYLASFIVAILTIISYGYKFIVWHNKIVKHYRETKKKK